MNIFRVVVLDIIETDWLVQNLIEETTLTLWRYHQEKGGRISALKI